MSNCTDTEPLLATENSATEFSLPQLPDGKSFTVFVEGIPTDELGDAPKVAKFTIDNTFLATLAHLVKLVKSNGLVKVCAPHKIEWESQKQYGIQAQELWVTADFFHWHARDEADYPVETRAISFEDLMGVNLATIPGGHPQLAFGVRLDEAQSYFDEDEENAIEDQGGFRTAFDTSEEDIERVLRQYSMRVANSEGLPFDLMAERIYAGWSDAQFNRIAKSAIDAGTDMVEQTEAAEYEIFLILRETGVLC